MFYVNYYKWLGLCLSQKNTIMNIDILKLICFDIDMPKFIFKYCFIEIE